MEEKWARLIFMVSGASLLIRRKGIRLHVLIVEICIIYINVPVTKHCQQNDNLLLYDL